MKRLLLLLTLLAPCVAFAGTPAESVRVDATGHQYTNWCTGEIVTVTGGDFLVVYRRAVNGNVNGVHILNKVTGSFTATGNDSGDEYRVNLIGKLPDDVSVSNFHDGTGALNIVINVEVIDLSNPGSGISQVKALIVISLDGSGSGGSRIWEVSTGCVGG